MAEVAENRVADRLETTAYATNWEHLYDELRSLDLRLYRQALRERPHQPSTEPLASFTGLVLSEAEIIALLTNETSTDEQTTSSPTATQEQSLTEATIKLDVEIEARRTATLNSGIFLALPYTAQLFHLSRFEEKCLLLCLAPELSRKYEKIYAYLQDDVTRKRPTMDLLLKLYCQGPDENLRARTVLTPQSHLFKYRLCEISDAFHDGGLPLLSRPLKVDDRVVSFLLGLAHIDTRLDPFATLVAPQTNWTECAADEETYSRTLSFVQKHLREASSERRNLILHFYGPEGAGRQALAEAIAGEIGLTLIVADVERMLSQPGSFAEGMWLLGREVLLQPGALLLENIDCLFAEPEKHKFHLKSLLEAVSVFSRLTFITSTRAWQAPRKTRRLCFVSVELKLPDINIAKRIWEKQLKACERIASDVKPEALASRFRFAPSVVRDALLNAEDAGSWKSPEDRRITTADLFAACRVQASLKLGSLARKIEPKYTWPEIILPDDQLNQLRELCNQAKCRHIVYGDWGFDRKLSAGKGLTALFSGPPGTGKTMAAEVIANDLQLDLYKIDLSQVVSKYIGETEKNLHKIFQEAQTSTAILFFDEADALFGKRSEVKDAHDRYANIEVAYLLQKMEEYEGIAILATNLRGQLDEAFVRRMHFIVEFPFPDEEYRRRIWEVTFPREAPLGSDVSFSVLARAVKLAGGNIKNIGLAAAFYAAANGRVISMSNLIQATSREYQKLGRTWNELEQDG
jgi:SpoVK/Ycf46/Vps4 family AAA+-type ATPase